MAKINLLPWRDERREELKKEFMAVLGLVFVLAALLVFARGMMVDAAIAKQEARNSFLTTHISDLDKKVAEIKELKRRRDELLDRMKVIQQLQGNRPIIVRVYDQLVRTLPDGVFYTDLEAKGTTITIDGVAESNNRVSSLMRNLDASDWFVAPNLDSVKAAPDYGDQAAFFKLTVRIQPPQSEEGEG